MDNEIIFAVVIMIWFFIGGLGTLNAKADRVNYEMIIFLCFSPCIPIIAYFLGIA